MEVLVTQSVNLFLTRERNCDRASHGMPSCSAYHPGEGRNKSLARARDRTGRNFGCVAAQRSFLLTSTHSITAVTFG